MVAGDCQELPKQVTAFLLALIQVINPGYDFLWLGAG